MKTKVVKIQVTQKDIDGARKYYKRYENSLAGSPACNCPIARAAKRGLRPPVSVYPGSLWGKHTDGTLEIKNEVVELPVRASKFASFFDWNWQNRSRSIKPFSFNLRVPDTCVR